MNWAMTAARVAVAFALISAASRPGLAEEATARKPEVWAVIISIDAYNDPALPDGHGAIRDGAGLVRWFTETAHWGRSHVLMMNENGVSRPGAPNDPISALTPTRSNLNWALTRWLGHRVRPGDLVVVSFAGQAAVAGDRTVLLPIDAKADDLTHTGWSPEEAIDDLARKRCAVTLWLDTSPFGRERAVAAGDVDPTAGARFLNRLTRWPGVSAWLAADDKPAAEGKTHSPFTAALLDGLGTRPNNVLACLDRMQQDPGLRAQGFRVRGGISPDLTLWPVDLLPEHQFRPGLLLQQGHADAVTAVASSADGEFLVTASLDSTVRIWRLRDRESVLLKVLPYHMVGVTALALSPDGRFVASGDGTGQLRVWDMVARAEKPKEGPSPHSVRIAQVAFGEGKEGTRLVSLDQDGRGVVWDPTGQVLRGKPLSHAEVIRVAGAGREAGAAFALTEPDGTIHRLGGDGNPAGPRLKGTGGRPTSLGFSADGRRLAVGDEEGRVFVCDVETGASVSRLEYGEKIGALRFDPSGALAVASGAKIHVTNPGQDGPGLVLSSDDVEIDSATFSPDGRWLAALSTGGRQLLWDLDDRAHPELRALPVEGKSTGFTCQAFSRDGRRLVAGEGDGGVRSWELAARREEPRISPHRGKVDRLAVSSDGRYLLQITHDHQALVWDLKVGRGAKPLPGGWTSGAFLADGSRIVMTRDAKHGGDVVMVDRASGNVRPIFDRPVSKDGQRLSLVGFDRVVVSRDGRNVAATTVRGQDEIACVWGVGGGKPRVFRGHTRMLTSLGFSADGRFLLTASEDGTAKVWDLAPEGPGPDRPVAELADPKTSPITAAQFSPSDPHRVLASHLTGPQASQVLLWEWEAGKPARPRSLGEIQGRAHAVVFTDDGRWLGVSGQERSLNAWTLADGQAPARVRFQPGQQHTEQVNALVAWPGATMFASGGDDTTIRLWGLDPKTRQGNLLGTLVAAPAIRVDEPPLEHVSQASLGTDWVAFTPEGVYDSSFQGDRLVSFVLDREVRPLEQYASRYYRFQLTEDLRQGRSPVPLTSTVPPNLIIDVPPIPEDAGRDVELKVATSDPSLPREGLRLFQNGVPVREADDFVPEGANSGQYAVRVRLRRGTNRFYAMASRRNDVDARSQDVDLSYDKGVAPARVHVLALGVKSYRRNSLRYPDGDARGIADHIHRHGVGDSEDLGEKIILTDTQVNERSVENAFADLRRVVKDRPEDTVVVFLAGHTDILKAPNGRERFTLLLSRFPFPDTAPLLAMNRGIGMADDAAPELPTGVDLPFYVIYRNLSRLGALQRLIIIDACQAEAVRDDPGVRQIQQLMANEQESRRTKTSYLLAARRGELATESETLGHGLLTYVLLRGMQAPGLKPLPDPLPKLEGASSADTDRDGVVSTQELRDYADRLLHTLAAELPTVASRGGGVRGTAPAAPEGVQVQASDSTFGLVTLPKVGPNE